MLIGSKMVGIQNSWKLLLLISIGLLLQCSNAKPKLDWDPFGDGGFDASIHLGINDGSDSSKSDDSSNSDPWDHPMFPPWGLDISASFGSSSSSEDRHHHPHHPVPHHTTTKRPQTTTTTHKPTTTKKHATTTPTPPKTTTRPGKTTTTSRPGTTTTPPAKTTTPQPGKTTTPPPPKTTTSAPTPRSGDFTDDFWGSLPLETSGPGVSKRAAPLFSMPPLFSGWQNPETTFGALTAVKPEPYVDSLVKLSDSLTDTAVKASAQISTNLIDSTAKAAQQIPGPIIDSAGKASGLMPNTLIDIVVKAGDQIPATLIADVVKSADEIPKAVAGGAASASDQIVGAKISEALIGSAVNQNGLLKPGEQMADIPLPAARTASY